MGTSKNVLLLCTLLMLLIISSSSLASARSSPTMVHRAYHARKGHRHRGWPKKPWMNHGSFRDPLKHLMKPSSEEPLSILKIAI
ncbi:hypothetical protein RND81_08G150600 [Saponaria officinalis]|uniref:Uncharacterized protein n=1 Tax=Saponaria officinalis TaxID=3572 RepID=A0AAW1J8C9_SAPOF